MALHIYRYRRDAPYTTGQLQRLVHSTANNQAAAGGAIYDIQVDDTRLADLDEIMGAAGYTRIATDPVGTPATQIRVADGTILTLGTIADGQGLIRSGTTLVGGVAFDARDLLVFDHFVTGNVDLDELGLMGWRIDATGTGNNVLLTGEEGHPGIVRILGGTAAAARSAIEVGNTSQVNVRFGTTGSNPLVFECLVSPRTVVGATGLRRYQIGIGVDWNVANPTALTDAVYIRFEPGVDTNWTGVTARASTRTTQDLGIAPVLNSWYRVGFTVTYGGTPSVQFRINGVNVGSPITTNIPTSTTLGPGIRVDASGGGGGNAELAVDYILITQQTNKET